ADQDGAPRPQLGVCRTDGATGVRGDHSAVHPRARHRGDARAGRRVMAEREFYRDHERDLGILARVAPPGSDMHGFLVDDETAATSQILIEAAIAAVGEAIP